MMKKIRRRLEDWMAALAFAEAGDHDTVIEIMGWKKRERKAKRKQINKRNHLEIRAPEFRA